MTPFKVTSPQHDIESVRQHLACFAGDPTPDPEEASKQLHSPSKHRTISTRNPPSWTAFQHALRQAKHKAPGSDHIAPHLFQWFSRDLQWHLHTAIRCVWEQGTVPRHWLNVRITMIYKA